MAIVVVVVLVVVAVWPTEDDGKPLVQATIHEAARRGDLADVKRHLRRGAVVDARDADGRTPLHMAASEGQMDIVEYLVRKGADVNAKDKGVSMRESMEEIAEQVYRDTRRNPRLRGMSREETDEAFVESMESAGMYMDDRIHIGATPLHLASMAGHVRVVEFLLDHGADVNASGKKGFTPLCGAVADLRRDVAKLLISRGANVNAKDERGWPLLHAVFLTFFGHNARGNFEDRWELLALLIDNGADVNTRGVSGRTVLHSAAQFGLVSLAEFLISKGADVNAKDDDGNTPLRTSSSWSGLLSDEGQRKSYRDLAALLRRHGGVE